MNLLIDGEKESIERFMVNGRVNLIFQLTL